MVEDLNEPLTAPKLEWSGGYQITHVPINTMTRLVPEEILAMSAMMAQSIDREMVYLFDPSLRPDDDPYVWYSVADLIEERDAS